MLDNNTKEFLASLLDHNIRIDGRQSFQIREPKIYFLDKNGHLIYRQGNTQIIVKINAQITAPKPERPSQGFTIFRVNCMACQGNFQQNKKYAIQLSKLLEKVIIGSNALDPESLCILTAKFVWQINIDCIVVKDDGNIIDTVLNSVMIGLMDFKKPIANVQQSYVKLGKKQLSLSLAHTPFSFSFGLYNNSIYIDPTIKEESISQTRITITMNVYKQICSIHKPGGKGISRNILSGATRVCENQIKNMTNKMREVIKRRPHVQQLFNN